MRNDYPQMKGESTSPRCLPFVILWQKVKYLYGKLFTVFRSEIRDSNPWHQLGRMGCYHYTNFAKVGDCSPDTSLTRIGVSYNNHFRLSSLRQDLNLRPELYKSPALPLSYKGNTSILSCRIELTGTKRGPTSLPRGLVFRFFFLSETWARMYSSPFLFIITLPVSSVKWSLVLPSILVN